MARKVRVALTLPAPMVETLNQMAVDERRHRPNVIEILLSEALAARAVNGGLKVATETR